MVYQGNRGSRRGKNENRITGLNKTKTKNLYVGSAEGEYLDRLVAKIKKAKATGKGVVFFLWRNDGKFEGPPFSLNVDVSQDSKRRAIEPDDEDGDDLFDDTEEMDEDEDF